MFDTGTSTLPSLAEVGTAQGPAEISESQTAGPNEVVPSLDGAETQIAATDSPSSTHASGFLAPQISSDPSLASSTNTVGASVPAAAEELTETLRSANGPPHPELNAVPPANHSTGSTSGPYIDPDLLPGPKQALIDGLTALGNWANTLDNYGKLASSLPLIGSNLGQILDFGGLLLTRLRDPIVAYLNGDPTPTTDELVAALDALDFSGGGLSVQTTGVQGGRVPGQGEFKFDLVFRATRTVSLPINFGPTNDDLDLGIRGSANVDVAASVVFNLSFGLKDLVESAPGSDQWSLTKTNAESFFIQSASLTASASVLVNGAANLNARVGFVDATVTNGDLSLQGNYTVALVDPGLSPGSVGKITATELAAPIGNWVNVTLSGSASARLPVTSTLFPGSQDLTLSWADVNSPTTLSSNVGSLVNFSSFENLTPQTFVDGVNSLANWADLLNNVNMLGRPLPLVSEALRDTLDLKNFLVNRLLTQTAGYDSVQSLVTRLKGVSGFTASGITAALSGNELTVTVPLNATINRAIPFILGHPDLPLNLTVPGFNLSVSVTGTLVLGINIATKEFYLRDDAAVPELTVTGTLSVNNFSGSGGIGFLSVQVANGSAQLSVTTSLDFKDPSNDRKLGLPDFAAGVGVLNSVVTTTFAGSGSLSVQVSSPFAGISPQTLTASWPDLTNQSSFTINLASLAAFTGFNSIRANVFGFGLSQLAQLLDNLSNNNLGGSNPLQTKLPLLNASLAELIDFDVFLKDALTRFTEVKYGPGGEEQMAFSNSSELLTLLRSIPGVGVANVTSAVNAEDIRYTLHLDKQLNVTRPISLGVSEVVDLTLTGTATLALDVDIDVTFGVTKSTGAFFILVTPGPIFSAGGTATVTITGATRLGFLAVTLNSATASLVANLSIRLKDPASDSPATPGKISSTEIGGAALANLFTVGLAGATAGSAPSANFSINLTGTLGAWSKSGTLAIQWSDLRDPTSVSVNTTGIQDLFNFNSIKPLEVIEGLLSLPDLVAGLTDLAKFGANLPLIGSSLGGIVTLATQVKGYLDALAPVGSDGKRAATFTTAQALETRLEQILGGGPTVVTVTINNSEIQFAFSFRQSFVNRDISYSINEGVVGLNFQSQGTVRVNGFAEAKIRFGLAYGPGVPINQRFFLVPGVDSSASLNFKLDAGVTAPGSLGLLTVSVTNGTAKIGDSTTIANDATLRLSLVDPNSNGRITLGEILADPLAILGAPTLLGRVEVVLPLRANGITIPVGKNPRIELIWSNIAQLSSLSPNAVDLDVLLASASNFNLSSAVAGIQAILQMIGQWANVPIMDVKIPLIDVRLKDIFNFVQQASQFFNTISAINAATAQAFDSAVTSAFVALGLPAGSALVASTDASQHNPTDLSNPRLRYLFRFHHDFLANDIDFKWGNDLFSLALKLKPALSIDAQIEFGLSKDRGFYIVDRDTAAGVIRPGDKVPGGEIQLSASIIASNFVAGGQFGPVVYGVRDGNAAVAFGVAINLTDPGSNGGGVGIITASELTGNILGVLKPSLVGNASLVLPIGLFLGNGGPGVKATFSLYWDAAKPGEFHFGAPNGSTDPSDGFTGIQFELGEFLRKLIGPFLEKIDQFNPLPRDLVRTLNTKLPVINKSPIELLGSFTGAPEIALLFQIVQVVQDLSAIVNGGKDLDLSIFSSLGAAAPANPGSGSTNGGAPVSGSDGFLSSLDPYNIEIFGGKPSEILSNLPGAIIKILLKQDVDLISWDPPAFKIDYEFNSPPIRLFSIGIPFLAEAAVEAQIYGKLGFFADLEIGFSTRGIFFDPDGAGPDKPNILNGFFIGDNIVNGTDGFETGFYGEVGLRLLGTVRILGIDAVQIYGQGGLRGTIGLDLSDVAYLNNDPTKKDHVIQRRDNPKGDNRVYLDEIAWITSNYGFTCALSLGGSLEVVLGVGARALCGFWGCVIDLYDETTIPIVNWDVPCEPIVSDLAVINGSVLSMHPDNGLGDKEITLTIRRDQNGNAQGLRIQRHTLAGEIPYMISSLDADTDIYGNGIEDGRRARLTTDKKTYMYFGLLTQWVPVSGGPDQFSIDEKNEVEDFQLTNPNGPNYAGGVDTLILEGGRTNDVFNLDPQLTQAVRVKHITVHGGPGNDRIQFGNIDPSTSYLQTTTVEGGLGDDRVQGTFASDTLYGDEGNDVLMGEDGNDIIRGGDGNDTLSGGAGNDFLAGEAGADKIYGQAGVNTIYGGSEEDEITGGDDRDIVFGEAGRDQIGGSRGDDDLHGGSEADKILGNEGNDTIFGDAGNDELEGGEGNDVVAGGSEDDVIKGDLGNDVLSGNAGKDFIYGNDGDDQIAGNEGEDMIYGGAGSDVIDAGSEDDTVYGEGDNDLILGQSGNDKLYAGTGHDEVYGGPGADLIEGEEGNDLLFGDAGNDVINGGNGIDRIVGGGKLLNTDNLGADVLSGGAGADIILGDDGFFGSVILLGGVGADIISGGADDDDIYGQGGDDIINADAGMDLVFGNDGNDTITGGDDNDVIHGDAGADTIYGNLGYDIVTGDDGNDLIYGNEDTDDLYGGTGVDTIYGGSGVDRVWGGDGNDFIYGEAGGDILRGELGDDLIEGGSEADVIYGGAGADTVVGGTGADLIYGGLGDDVVYGFQQLASGDDNTRDDIFGEEGDDQIWGGGGDDRLDGGAGVDSLFGGDGNDLLMAATGVGDLLLGEGGDDHIIGSDEGADFDPNFSDTVYFGDRIEGGTGDDIIEGLGGADSISGGEGDDTIDSGAGADFVSAGEGDDFVFAGRGLGDRILGDAGNDELYGSQEGSDTISGGLGNDRIYGQGGNDTLSGDDGDDLIDGGGGTDILNGGSGNDELLGGGGAGDQLNGGTGDDILRGSDDGADVLQGDAGRDRIYGNGGNDTISGGAGDDILDGGAGDDVISGDAGSDLILGGAQHDTLYGHLTGGAGDDNLVDLLYGDFGTNANEVGSGRDRLFGNGGNDLLYGEGEDDAIDAGLGTSNLVNFGAGEAIDAFAFNPPAATPAPAVQPTTGISRASSTLQNRVNSRGRWVEFSGSASGKGLSNSNSLGLEPSLTVAPNGDAFVSWVDGRNGNYEIYVARISASGVWSELSNSAREGGVSNTLTSSRRPTLALDASNRPMVAWTEFTSTGSEVRVARWDGANWVALGTSLSAGGVSAGAPGTADFAVLVQVTTGPVLGWIQSTGGVANVYAKQFSGGVWSGFGGAAAASGTGLSASATSIADLALATNGTQVSASWTQTVGASTEIYLKQSSGAAWVGVAGSSSAGGVSATPGASSRSSLAYLGSDVFAAWQDETSGFSEIYAARFSGGIRTAISAAGGGVSNTRGHATLAQLASQGTSLSLVWIDDTVQNRVGTRQALYATAWNGTSFAAAVSLDRSYEGVSQTGGLIREVDLAVDSTGHPFIAWTDQAEDSPQTYLRANTHTATSVHIAGSGFNVQAFLDAQDLGAGDVLIILGSVGGFNVSAGDAGLVVLGGPGSTITGDVVIAASDVSLQALTVTGSVNAVNASRFSLRESVVNGGVTIHGGNAAQLVHNTLRGSTGVTLTGAASAPALLNNRIEASQLGLSVTGAGAVGIVVFDNNIIASNGVSLGLGSDGNIERNDIRFTATGLDIIGPFGGVIHGNAIHGGTLGVKYRAAATLSGNRIYGNATGVEATASGSAGLGFVGEAIPNQIFENGVGVVLTGLMRAQHVHHNTTGVTGSGVLGGADIETANLIEANEVGVNFIGIIQFNRISANGVGIAANNGQIILHNLIYRNTTQGILVSARSDVRIVNNTIYAPSGDAIRLTNGSSNVEIRNNILWAEQGYALYVANDSQKAVASDYNDLFATGAGRIAYWTKDFTDVLDLQADVALIDLHSVGRTSVNPLWAEPRFLNRARNDYRVFDLVAGQRFSSPTVDAADPVADLGLSANYINLLSNPGFELGVQGWAVNVGAATRAGDPAAFAGSSYFYSGAVAEAFAEQTVNLLSAGFSPTDLDSQDFAIVFGGRVRSAAETKNDRGKLRLFFYDSNGAEIGIPLMSEASNVSDRWELVGQHKVLPFGTRSVKIRFDADRESGGTNDSYLEGAFVYLLSDTWMPNQGALGNTVAEQGETPRAHIAVRYPDLYTDWEREKPRLIRWESYNNLAESSVRIDLYQDDPVHGPALFKTISAATPDDGEFLWQPVESQLGFGVYGLRIVVSLVADNSVIDRSSERFTVPETGDVYWVDDSSDTNDEYTPGALGSNRNTGKLASAPKPNPINVLRVYDLGSGAVLNVDTGLYPLIYTATLSSKPGVGLGTDRGFLFRGPTNPSRTAEFITAIPDNGSQTLIFLDDADLVQIRFLTLTGGKSGIHATGGSNDLVVERVVLRDGSSHGLLVDGNSDFDLIKDVTSYNHPINMHGVAILGGAGGVIQNLISFNNQIGLYSSDVAVLTILGADLFYNITGLRQDGATTGVWSNVRVHANSGGIEVQGVIVLNDAEAYDNLNHGISSNANSGTLTINRAKVYGNVTGVYLWDGAIYDSRIYGNSGVGVLSEVQPIDLVGNTIYSNDIGLMATAYTGGAYLIQNNVFYGHKTAAVRITGTQPAGYEIVSNTFYEPTADGIYASATDNVRLRNNIIWTQSGYGVRIANDSQIGFTSNFNLLYATDSGKVGFWQGDRVTLTDWQFSNFRDGDSLSVDPQFVDADGLDNILGAQLQQGLNASYYIGRNFGGAPALSRLERVVNFSSTFSSPDPSLLGNDNWSARFQGYIRIEAAGQYTFRINSGGPQRLSLGGLLVIDDFSSPSNAEQTYVYSAAGPGWLEIGYEMADDGGTSSARLEWITPASGGEVQVIAVGYLVPSVVVADGTDDNFHERSRFGSFKPGTGFTADLSQSPAIDRGRPGDDFSRETEENGGYVNLGAYGNTATASRSPAQYILVTNPNGGERLPQKTTFDIRWRSDGFSGNVRLQYSLNGAGGPFIDIATNEANDGSYNWTLSQAVFQPSDQYVIRIASLGNANISDTSDALFSVIPPIANYYVNDGSTELDEYTLAPGNDANDGLTRATPKLSVRAILETYDLEFGDTIFVDTGVYNLSANIIITRADSGARIQGPITAGREALLNRGNVSAGSYVFELNDADAITLSHLSITGAYEGIYLSAAGDGSSLFTLQHSRVFENANAGVNIVSASSAGAVIRDNAFYGDNVSDSRDQNYGVFSRGLDPTVLRNQAYHINGTAEYGIYLENVGDTVIVRDNLVFGNQTTGLVVIASAFQISGNVARDNGRGYYFEDTTASQPGSSDHNLAYGNGTGFDIRGYGNHGEEEALDNTTGFNIQDFYGVVDGVRAWRNGTGVTIINGTLQSSRVFGNSGTGIYVGRGDITLQGNVIYDNATGIHSQTYYGTNRFEGNLIYDNRTRGVLLDNVNTSNGTIFFTGNTVSQVDADALQITGSSRNVQLLNNILQVSGADRYALRVANSSQGGFSSDYNLFHLQNGAKLALWQNPIAALADWRYEIGFDVHSITGDPRFVNSAGADGLRGYADQSGLRFEYFGNANFSGSPAITLFDGTVNFAATFGSFRGFPGQPADSQSFRWTGEIYLPSGGEYTFVINGQGPQRLTLAGSVLIEGFVPISSGEQSAVYTASGAGWVSLMYEVVDPANGGSTMALLEWTTPDNSLRRPIRASEQIIVAGASTSQAQATLRYGSVSALYGEDDDFHLMSTAGSWHGGTFALDLLDSPAIDSGSLISPYERESAENGARVNLGFEGNTGEASRTRSPGLQLLTPNGFDKLAINSGVLIQWRTIGQVDFVDIEVSLDGGVSFQPIALGLPNDGNHSWNPSQASVKALIRIRNSLDAVTQDVSDNVFSIGAVGNTYYVNDASRAGDQYSLAAGSNLNSGKSAMDPMLSLGALLAAYDLGPGDIILVDTGYYSLATNIRITADDAGVTIQGPTNVSSSASDYVSLVMGSQPLAYYRLAEGSGTVANDTSGNGLNGIFRNTPALGRPGALVGDPNKSVGFDGTNEFVELPSGFADFTGGITLEMWINPTGNGGDYQRIFDLGNGTQNDNIVFARRGSGADLTLVLVNGTATVGELAAFGVLEFNKWQHVAATIEADGTATIYRNGVVVSTGTLAVPRNVVRTKNYIGRSNWASDGYYSGGYDEAAVYNRALSAEVISQHYFTIASQGALFHRGNVTDGSNVFQVEGAEGVTLANLAITGGYNGIQVSAASRNFQLKSSRIFENANVGLTIIDAGSSGAVIQDNVFYGDTPDSNRDQNYGVFTRGLNPTILRNTAFHLNGSDDYGIYIENGGTQILVRDNLVYNNSNIGLAVIGSQFEVFGNVARNSGRGFYFEDNTAPLSGISHDNVAYNNTTGFDLRGYGDHYDEVAYENTTGFYLQDIYTTVHDIRAWLNTTGVSMINGALRNSLIFANRGTGVSLGRGDLIVQGNKIYDNATGIYSQTYYGTNLISNNLIYGHTLRGVILENVQTSGGVTQLISNTIMELAADVIQVTETSQNVLLKNNILWVGGLGHYAINVVNSAQRGFSSDYNLIHFTDEASLGLWQNAFGSLADWRYELGFDLHSLSGDPLFVDPDGADNVLGYRDALGLRFEYFANANFSGNPAVTLFDRYLDFGSTTGSFRSLSGQPSDSQSFRWTGEVYLSNSGTYTFWINSQGPQRLSVGGQLLADDLTTPSNAEQSGTYQASGAGWVTLVYEVVDPAGGGATMARLEWATPSDGIRRVLRALEAGAQSAQPQLRNQPGDASLGEDDNFHLQSRFGSFRPGAGGFSNDPNSSPALDAGDLTSPFGAEPLSNGGRINLGYDGNTSEASKSSSAYVQLLSFNGGEKVRVGQASLIRWRSLGVGPLDIYFSADNGANWSLIGDNEVNDGLFAWNPSSFTLSGRLRLVDAAASLADPNAAFDISDAVFTVGVAGTVYYVNDSSAAGSEFGMTSAGSNSNSGTTPGDPMASLNALLSAYDLNPGDRIYVDTGLYRLPTNIRIAAQDSGVEIIGPSGAGHVATFDRGNVNDGQWVMEMRSAKNVTLRNLKLTGGQSGLVAYDADGLKVYNSLFVNNAASGFFIETDTSDVLVSGNTAYGTSGNTTLDQENGFYLRGDRMTVVNNISYKVGAQVGTGFYIDSAEELSFSGNFAYNNINGITITTSQADIHHNDARDNDRGIWVSDTQVAFRTAVHDNRSFDNDVNGFEFDDNIDAFANLAHENNGAGFRLGTGSSNTVLHDNTSYLNGTGIHASLGLVERNRVFGNVGAGVYLDYNSVTLNANSIFGNLRGVDVVAPFGAFVISNNLIYDNANQAIYVHGALSNSQGGVKIINNTLHHEAGSAIKLENNGNNIKLWNNIVWVNGGLGIEVIGNITGLDSNYNNLFAAKPGASVGKWLANAQSADLAAWRVASGEDAASYSLDPQFVDINGPDNLFGWEKPDPQGQFADFGRDDNFHLRRGSSMIDSADSDVAPARDADNLTRQDDLGSLNNGNGVFRFYDLGAFEFRGSSNDVTAPQVKDFLPMGLADNAVIQVKFSTLILRFSEALDAVSARSLALYSLLEAGKDGTFGTGDDIQTVLTNVVYTPGDTEIRLDLPGPLAQGVYRFTLGTDTEALIDQAGNALDGDSNGSSGGKFTRTFTVNLAPEIQGFVLNDGAIQRSRISSVTLQFSENVQPSLTAGDFRLTHLGTGIDISTGQLTLQYDANSNRLTISFASLPEGRLADGNYRLRIVAASVSDVTGKALPVDFVATFHTLRGDANGDRLTNDLDLYRVWQNLLKPAAARSSNEDLNGDGLVDAADLEEIKDNYLASLPSAPTPLQTAQLTVDLSAIALAENAVLSEAPIASPSVPASRLVAGPSMPPSRVNQWAQSVDENAERDFLPGMEGGIEKLPFKSLRAHADRLTRGVGRLR